MILVLGTDPLHSSPILDLRIRKAMRRNGARLAVATERPTPLDGGAEAIARYAPGEASHFLTELKDAIGGAENVASPLAGALRDAGIGGEEPTPVVVIWGERMLRDDGAAGPALLELADALGVADADGAGLLEVPELANARGLREAGCLPDAGPGLTETEGGRATEEIRAGLDLRRDRVPPPLRSRPDPRLSRHRRLGGQRCQAADHLVVFSTFENATTADGRRRLPAGDPRREGRHRHATPTAACSASAHLPLAPERSARTGGSSRSYRSLSAWTRVSPPNRPRSPLFVTRPRSTRASPTPKSEAVESDGRTARRRLCARGRGRGTPATPSARAESARGDWRPSEDGGRGRLRKRSEGVPDVLVQARDVQGPLGRELLPSSIRRSGSSSRSRGSRCRWRTPSAWA